MPPNSAPMLPISTRTKARARNRIISGLKRIAADLQAFASSTGPPHSYHQTNAHAVVENISSYKENGATHSDGPAHKKLKSSPPEAKHTAINSDSTHQDLEGSVVPSLPPSPILAASTESSTGSVSAFVQQSPIYLLPNELLLAIGSELLLEDVRSLLPVCRLFRDLFFPVYLSGYGFRNYQGYIRLASRQHFTAFQSLHRLSKIGSTCHLTIAFSEDVEYEASCVNYSLSQLPKGTFASVRFTCHPGGVSVSTLADLLGAFSQGGCRFLEIGKCLLKDGHRKAAGSADTTWPLERLELNVDLYEPLFRSLIVATSKTLRRLNLTSALRESTRPLQWHSLLTTLQLPQLTLLRLDEEVPLVTLVEFLSRHPIVSTVAVDSLTEPQRLEDASRHPFKQFELGNLTEISGPPSYVEKLLRCASTPLSLARLSMVAGHLSASSLFSDASRCMSLCHGIKSLLVTMPAYTSQYKFDLGENFGLFLDIEVLRIRLVEDSESFLTFPDSEILEVWNQLHTHLPNVTDFQLFETLYYENRCDLFEALVLQSPALSISVRSGTDLFQNEVAVKSGSKVSWLPYED